MDFSSLVTEDAKGLIEAADRMDPPRKLRVLIYTTLFPNSVRPLTGSFVLERMRHLLPFAEMTVIAPVPYAPPIRLHDRWSQFAEVPRSEMFSNFRMDHPRYLVFPKVGMTTHAMSMFVGSYPQVRRRLRAADFDLIDAHYVYPDGLAAVMLGHIFRKPVVVSARGSDINLFPGMRTIRPLVRQVLKRADALIAVSNPLKDAMVALGCRDDRITVIGNGVDSAKFTRGSRPEMRQTLGLPANRPIILSVGHLVELKGFHILVDAMARLKAVRPDALLVIVGEGVHRSWLERRIQALKLESNVMLVGARAHEELCAWYNAADLFCLASASEGWPNVVLEAMACGLPVLATPVGSIPQIISSAALGTLVDRDSNAFASGMDTALSRPWDCEAISRHAQAHRWDSVAEKVLSVYRKVLGNRSRS